MVSPARSEIWWVNLDPTKGHEQAGTRPSLVISEDTFNAGPANLVIAIPMTTQDKQIRTHIRVSPDNENAQKESFIKTEDIRCLSKKRFQDQMGSVSPNTMQKVETCLRILLGL